MRGETNHTETTHTSFLSPFRRQKKTLLFAYSIHNYIHTQKTSISAHFTIAMSNLVPAKERASVTVVVSTGDDDDERAPFSPCFARIESITTASKKRTKTIVHNLSHAFPENTVTAVMGPSGSGKTTLLSFLTNSLPSNLRAKGERQFPGV